MRTLLAMTLVLSLSALIGCPSEPHSHDDAEPHAHDADASDGAQAAEAAGAHDDHDDHDHAEAEGSSPSTATEAAGDVTDTAVSGKARDPMCGMTIAADGKRASTFQATRFYFCSAACLEKFDADPGAAATGLPGKDCVCTIGEMANCDCGHCEGEPERCTCGDPEDPSADSGDHDHSSHDH